MPREKIFNVPGIVLALIAAFASVHGVREYLLSDSQDARVLQRFAFVPAQLSYVFDPDGLADIFAGGLRGRAQESAARFWLGDGRLQWWTPLTYAFLHADWVHTGVNSVWMLAFGTPVARRMGGPRFLVLFALTAIAGAALHFALHRFELSPVVGASAAVSGAMAAACRFVFQPGGPLGDGFNFGSGDAQAYNQPAVRVLRALTSGRTMPFIVLWFAVNFLFGYAAPLGISDNPIAWEAHVGGFLAGLFLFDLFDPVRGKPPLRPMGDDGVLHR